MIDLFVQGNMAGDEDDDDDEDSGEDLDALENGEGPKFKCNFQFNH